VEPQQREIEVTMPNSETTAEARARELIHAHLPAGTWNFSWSPSRHQLGRCDRYADGTGHIYLSLPWAEANTFAEAFVDGVVLHEIAHALVGPEQGHSTAWAAECRRLGGYVEFDTTLRPPKGVHHFRCGCGACYIRYSPPLPGLYTCTACRAAFVWPLPGS
jgi:hypothetical protein